MASSLQSVVVCILWCRKIFYKGVFMETNLVCRCCRSWYVNPMSGRKYFDSGLCGLCELTGIGDLNYGGVAMGVKPIAR